MYGLGCLLSAWRDGKRPKDTYFLLRHCCAWSVNFWQRLKKIYNDIYQLLVDLQVNFVIPKFHLEAHSEDCKSSFNLNHTVGAARTCGEGIEAGWADTNPAALSTHEMSLTYRHEILDDLFGAINWRKIRTMGAFSQMHSVLRSSSYVLGAQLLQDLHKAIPMARKQARLFQQLNAVVPVSVSGSWEHQIHEWDTLEFKKKHAKNSPYRDPVRSTFYCLFCGAPLKFTSVHTLAQAKLDLTNEEATKKKNGMIACHEMSPSNFILAVLDIEEKM